MKPINLMIVLLMAAFCTGSASATDVTLGNPSFESPVVYGQYETGEPEGWTKYAGYDDNIRVYTTDAPQGGGNQLLCMIGTDTRLHTTSTETIIGGAVYNFSFCHKAYNSGSSAGFTVYAVKYPNNQFGNPNDYIALEGDTSSLTNTSWEQFSYQFKAPAAQAGWYFCVYIWPSLSGSV